MAYSGEEGSRPVQKATTNEEIVALLQDDMKGEHAAIIQYLQHAYKIGEDAGEVPSEIEGIARDEMRHFRWLGELVVELGGDPTMQRDPIFLDGPSTNDLLALDVDAEQRAIDQYRDHIAAIDNAKVKLYLQRILMDELFHQGKFKDFIEELGGDSEKEVAGEDTGPWNKDPNPASQDLELDSSGHARPADLEREGRNDHPLVRMLNSRIQQEYETILIYLHQAFISQSEKQRDHLISDRAVWHMTHMGTLGEAIAGMDERPNMELDFSSAFLKQAPVEPGEFNRWALQREESLVQNTTELREQARNVPEEDEDEDLAADLRRIEGHTKFQVKQIQMDENY
ncbi:MAG TPA: ferritin-like domain-containing protein [Chloroflexia bacterium]|nr:ferritin-like domain-containing protein [Chloroflexia bacterium]